MEPAERSERWNRSLADLGQAQWDPLASALGPTLDPPLTPALSPLPRGEGAAAECALVHC